MIQITTKAGALASAIEKIMPMAMYGDYEHKCMLHFDSDDCVKLSAMQVDNYTYGEVRIPCVVNETDNSTRNILFIPSHLSNIVSSMKGDDGVSLYYYNKDDKASIYSDNKKHSYFEVLDNVKEIELPQRPNAAEVILKGDKFKEIIKRCAWYEYIRLGIKEKEFFMRAKNHKKNQARKGETTNNGIEAMSEYDMQYFIKFQQHIDDNSDVKLSFGGNTPIWIDFGLKNETTYIIAHREKRSKI